tara:strand:+ start:1066 stop:2826 length:1761 start_codon:yes stop_codon:yes gene_type:complete
MNTFAVDFETYYDKTCSIKTLGTLGYFSHPDFEAYRVSIVGDEGTKFVGDPRDFDWAKLNGSIILSHNASFDETLFIYGVKKGWWEDFKWEEWHCTADLSAFCGLPRSLKGATGEVFDLEMSKETRDSMMGKRWESMSDEFKQEVDDYALKDSELCLKLWEELKDRWPQRERDISRINRLCVQRGIPMDTELLKKQQEDIAKLLFDAENSIPWIGEAPPLSRKAFNEECRRLGLEPPHSLALTDEDANKWIQKHGKKYTWIGAVRDFRRINALKRKLESFSYATMSDGRYYGGIMYFGAHTGRFSGSGGNLNLQNLPRGDMFGVNLRNLISPEEDNCLVVADLSQIEVRTLCWLAEDHEALDDIRQSDDIYETFAIRFGLWDPEKGILKDKAPKLRHLAKTMVLGCGYGASAKRFASIADTPIEEAEKAVKLYRTKMQKVVRFWNHLSRKLYVSYNTCSDFVLELPSGRSLNYGKVKSVMQNGRRNYVAMLTKGSKKIPVKVYGGLLAENISQALARDVFSEILLRLEDLGINTVMHVHDEVVIETKKDDAEDILSKVLAAMSQAPDWIEDLPLAAEGKIVERYEK